MDAELVDLLRAELIAADYRTESVAALLGDAAEAARQRGVLVPARRVLAARGLSPLSVLTRLFLLGDPVAASVLDEALPLLGSAGLERLGLVARDPDPQFLRAALSLNPVTLASAGGSSEWWIISDLDDQLRNAPARPDHVMGVGGATRSLIAQAPPVRGPGPALDLGTGCGIVALHLARELAKEPEVRIVATDISERALTFARANAHLNGLADRIDFRMGSLFEPVADEQFDLILSNPPFVITPRQSGVERYEYRDGGMRGDDLIASVVRAAPDYLAEGGTLLCLANWECPWGVDGLERVRDWISGSAHPLAAWVMERDRVDPVKYAETWARDGGARPGSDDFDELMTLWLDDFAARNTAAIGLGSIRIERLDAAAAAPHGESVVHTERAGGAFSAAAGIALQRNFSAAILTTQMSDAQILDTHWLLDSAVTEEREHRPGEESPRAITLTTERGIARRVTADTLLAAAVGACDGDLSLRQIADALATLLEVDAAAAAEALIGGVRELVWMGMLAPAEAPSAASR
ncbi:methyltransferase [Leucobacter insecticola]|uniref:Methyltransferase n=1 Tax=Leucobacter insecticola TaxID=2714934 RepID=A0A6G8FJ35_9MICO|nr:methyltransferase [Leucobacter insecticola]QIM16476.1 methyltransferase [Leucobacter insecticola]